MTDYYICAHSKDANAIGGKGPIIKTNVNGITYYKLITYSERKKYNCKIKPSPFLTYTSNQAVSEWDLIKADTVVLG